MPPQQIAKRRPRPRQTRHESDSHEPDGHGIGNLILGLRRTARQEGIAVDHKLTMPRDNCHLDPLEPITDIREPFVFSSEEGLQKTTTDWEYPKEQFDLDKSSGAMELISQAVQLEVEAKAGIANEPVEEPRLSPMKLYVEEPLFRGDFAKTIVERLSVPALRYEQFKKYPVDDENDGGLKWSIKTKQEVSTFIRDFQKEKITVDQEVDDYLKEVISISELGENIAELSLQLPSSLGSLSPPLIPLKHTMFPELPPIIPKLTNEFEQWPDPEGDDSHEKLIEEVLEPLLVDEHIGKTEGMPDSPYEFVKSGIQSSSPIRTSETIENIKVEVPLTPPRSVKKPIPLSSIIQADEVLRWPEDENQDEDLPDFLEDVLQPEAVQVQRELEQEQLQEEDTTMRVLPPIMDFSRPKLPWDFPKESLKDMRNVKSWAGSAARPWRLIVKNEECSELQWVPFHQIHAEIPPETFDGDDQNVTPFLLSEREGELAEEQFLDSLMTHVEYSDDEEDELQYGIFEKESPTKEAPIVIEDDALLSVQDLVKKRKKTIAPIMQAVSSIKKKRLARIEYEERFSAEEMLSSFMASRGNKLQPDPTPSTPLRKAPGHYNSPTPIVTLNPDLDPNPPSANFVVSGTLMSNRGIFRRIKELYKSAAFLERDYRGRSDIVQGGLETDDAEMIIGPSIGVVHTTLQKLQQRPLPGDIVEYTSGVEVKRRIKRLSQKYEWLIVIVWNTYTTTITKSDSEVLKDFGKFTEELKDECNFNVQHVQGMEDNVAHWTAAAMMEHGDLFDFVEEETPDEMRLRQLGLNTYAAQAVIGQWRGPIDDFIDLSAEEQIKMFKRLVGNRVIVRFVDNIGKMKEGNYRGI